MVEYVCVTRRTWSHLFSAAAPNTLEPYLGQLSCLHTSAGTFLVQAWRNLSGDHLLPPIESLLSSLSVDFTWNLGFLRPTSSGEKQRHYEGTNFASLEEDRAFTQIIIPQAKSANTLQKDATLAVTNRKIMGAIPHCDVIRASLTRQQET